VVAGTGGDSGKTVVALGLASALADSGKVVAGFKKGPDYIDAAWMGKATGSPGINLDAFLMGEDGVRKIYARHVAGADFSVIEGNRGLYDGMDAEGTFSTSELAKLLKAPILLVVDATKTTRTLAATVLGCKNLDPECPIAGVVLNRIAGKRHSDVAKAAIEKYTGIPVLGIVPKMADENVIPDRHLGLVTVEELKSAGRLRDTMAKLARDHLDLDRITNIARSAAFSLDDLAEEHVVPVKPTVKIGVIRDSAFCFYYEDNFVALRRAGAELIEFSALTESKMPEIDGLYIGGGFPETHAEALAQNESLRQDIRDKAKRGLPIYAECGGLMYLARQITWRGEKWPMCSVLPVDIEMEQKPVGHGYTKLTVEGANPFFPRQTKLRGHEFHYSRVVSGADQLETAYRVSRGEGIGRGRDGLMVDNVLASYVHLHDMSASGWAEGMVSRAAKWKQKR
jgi:cobyrinic acid a,c-diamide synthase